MYNANFVIAEHFERHFEQREQFERQLAEKSELVEVTEIDEAEFT